MNWHHWYWWTWPAGFAIGFLAVCAFNWIRNEIGFRRTLAEYRARREQTVSTEEE